MSSSSSRHTRQRHAIREALARAGHPLAPKEILDAASDEAQGLGLATVYRTLKLLMDAGEVQLVEISGTTPRYELTDRGHHHHFFCRVCGRVFEVDACCGHFDELTPKGFSLEAHEVTLYGKCKDCQSRGPAAEAPVPAAHGRASHSQSLQALQPPQSAQASAPRPKQRPTRPSSGHARHRHPHG